MDCQQLNYELQIIQQPVRARMCGLGDKDRRQISPPPFVKLLITEKDTGKEVDIDQIDINSFVLVTELWSSEEQENLTLNQNLSVNENGNGAPLVKSPKDDNEENPELQKDTADKTLINPVEMSPEIAKTINSDSDESLGDIPTRNLIGNLVLNPFKLFDERGTKGIWFIMHDLSVRIEGTFKLKFLFVDLITNNSVHYFSQPFKVYSAKKFPGVVDSSPLGKVFASQGVKIPIRRENKPDQLTYQTNFEE